MSTVGRERETGHGPVLQGIFCPCLNVGWCVLGIRPAVGTIREGCEVAGDRHCICPWRIPVNHDLLLATFALNEIGHAHSLTPPLEHRSGELFHIQEDCLLDTDLPFG